MIGIVLAVLLAFLATGIPVGIGLAIVGLTIGYGAIGESSLAGLPSALFAGTSSFLLMAIPLFILMSEILRRGKVTELFFQTMTLWVGHLPGGLAVAAVLTSAIGASTTGSSVANAATMAIVAIPPMLARGYDRRFTYGLIAASGTLGIMIPPSIPMLLYGEITEESIGKLFIAGIIPGLLITAMLIIYAIVVCSRGGVYEPLPRASWQETWRYTGRALPALMQPVVVVGGIYSGIVTPTEAAALGVTYALILVTLVYRSITFHDLWRAFFDSLVTSAMILLIIAGSSVLGNAMTKLQLSQDLLAFIQGLNLSPIMFILLTMALLFVLGTVLEVISIIYIVLPLLFPVIVGLNIDPIWFAVLFTLNMEIALITPPVGMVLYVMTGILRRPITEIIHGITPFVLVLVGALLMLVAVPSLSTWLPKVLG
ncbi:MAG: TRAP transporter large permease [Hyphomicrobiaceae bacterium]